MLSYHVQMIFKPCVSGIIQYTVFCAWLLWLSKGLTHVVACIRNSFLFTIE